MCYLVLDLILALQNATAEALLKPFELMLDKFLGHHRRLLKKKMIEIEYLQHFRYFLEQFGLLDTL
jgi:hypothetical protein